MKQLKIKNKNKLIKVLLLLLISIIYTLLVKYYDTNAIGPKYTVVGFSSLNALFSNLTGYNPFFYKLTNILGYITFIIVIFYGIIGIKQLITKKNLLKVDKKIIFMGIFYILVLLVYILFEKIIINYRPIILEKELEASYPSSHTMLALCICLSSLIINKNYIKNKKILKIVNILIIILMLTLVIGRVLSGVHWISDIFGGIIISAFLVSIYDYLITTFK